MFHIMKLSFNYWYDRVAARLPECDREILLRPEIREVFRESIHEAFRQGTQAFRTELGLHVRNWGFSLNEIRVPIFLWHGLTDPFHNGKLLAAAFPECQPTLVPEGHLVLFPHWAKILEQVLQRPAAGNTSSSDCL